MDVLSYSILENAFRFHHSLLAAKNNIGVVIALWAPIVLVSSYFLHCQFSTFIILFLLFTPNAGSSYRYILWILRFGMLYSPPYLEVFMVLFAASERFVKLHFSLHSTFDFL